jgi:predicted GNAT family acetyltransferase
VDDSRTAGERALDETLEESFPASDAPANTVETGLRVGPVTPEPAVTDNRQASQFELLVDGQTAVLTYERTPTSLVLVHTEVPPSLRGRHLADALAQAAIDAAHAEMLQIVVVCPFVKAYLRRHPNRDTTPEQNIP